MELEVHSLAAQYVRLQDEMNLLHEGDVVRQAVAVVLAQLPDGPLALFSTSDQGAGLAAACAAARAEETLWRKIHVAYPPSAPVGYDVVIVEPLAGGAAWRDALVAIYPDAAVVTVENAPRPALAA